MPRASLKGAKYEGSGPPFGRVEQPWLSLRQAPNGNSIGGAAFIRHMMMSVHDQPYPHLLCQLINHNEAVGMATRGFMGD